MKAKIKKTGEIVDVICYNHYSTIRSHQDYVSYIDSKGIEHDKKSLNYYWDFEPIETITDKHWQDLRERAAIAAMQETLTILSSSDGCALEFIIVEGFRGDKKTYPNEIAQFSVACADALIEELKKK